MDQLICASLSYTHYWYEVGMLKVPANVCIVLLEQVRLAELLVRHRLVLDALRLHGVVERAQRLRGILDSTIWTRVRGTFLYSGA